MREHVTLGDVVFAIANSTPKQERPMNFILTYEPKRKDGIHNKIKAIKAVRIVFGLGLKEAKDVVERNGAFEFGIIVSNTQRMAVKGEYITSFLAAGLDTPANLLGHFRFEPIPEVTYREDFTQKVGIIPVQFDHA